MKIALKITGIIILFSFFSCTKDYYQPPDTKPENVSFSQDVQSIFDANCTSCHNGGGIPLDLTDGNSYNELNSTDGMVDPGNPDNSELYERITGTGALMPPSGSLPQGDIDLIYQWIEEGALNN